MQLRKQLEELGEKQKSADHERELVEMQVLEVGKGYSNHNINVRL